VESEKPKGKKSSKEPALDFATYLSDVPPESVKRFVAQFNITEDQVREKAEDMLYWWRSRSPSKKRSYSDPEAMLRNAIKKDFGKRTSQPAKPRIRNITEERFAREGAGEPLFESVGGGVYGSTI
jgi:hypothetical protein